MKKKSKKNLFNLKINIKIILIIVLIVMGIIFLIFQMSASGNKSTITRKFSSIVVGPGEEIKVNLIVEIKGSETYSALEEYIPEEWIIINEGGGGKNLKWVVIQDAQNTIYSYILKAPNQKGNYIFSGNYMFEKFIGPENMEGQTIITVG